MLDKLKKRFWSEVTVTPVDGGFAVDLDGRGLKTPAKAALVVPSAALAEMIRAEWAAVEAEVDPLALPYTRLCNAAIDKVIPQGPEIVSMLAEYGETDLICHRADSPESLVSRQNAAWDPVLVWVRQHHGLRFECAAGIMAVDQPAESLSGLRDWLSGQGPFALMALHDLITMSGSILLARAVADGLLDAEAAWAASRVDETFQEEQWGIDSIAHTAAKAKAVEFARAARLWEMVTDG